MVVTETSALNAEIAVEPMTEFLKSVARHIDQNPLPPGYIVEVRLRFLDDTTAELFARLLWCGIEVRKTLEPEQWVMISN